MDAFGKTNFVVGTSRRSLRRRDRCGGSRCVHGNWTSNRNVYTDVAVSAQDRLRLLFLSIRPNKIAYALIECKCIGEEDLVKRGRFLLRERSAYCCYCAAVAGAEQKFRR